MPVTARFPPPRPLRLGPPPWPFCGPASGPGGPGHGFHGILAIDQKGLTLPSRRMPLGSHGRSRGRGQPPSQLVLRDSVTVPCSVTVSQ